MDRSHATARERGKGGGDAPRSLIDYERTPFGRDASLAPLISGEGARGYYRLGYLACARDAVSSLRARRGGNVSAMPVLFLFRHYVELALKDVLAAAGAFAIELVDRRYGHDLAALWSEAEKVFANFGLRVTAANRRVLAELAELDGRADAFRYALDARDRKHSDRIGSVDLIALEDALATLPRLFERALTVMEEDEVQMDRDIADAVERDRS